MECEKKWQPLCLANGISHIGIPTGKLDESKAFYQARGFQPVLDTTFDHSSNRVSFLECSNLCLELYESDDVQGKSGAIDHFALDVEDIQTVYEWLCANHYSMLTSGIEYLSFFEHGVAYCIIEGVNGEKIEFNQRLKTSHIGAK